MRTLQEANDTFSFHASFSGFHDVSKPFCRNCGACDRAGVLGFLARLPRLRTTAALHDRIAAFWASKRGIGQSLELSLPASLALSHAISVSSLPWGQSLPRAHEAFWASAPVPTLTTLCALCHYALSNAITKTHMPIRKLQNLQTLPST